MLNFIDSSFRALHYNIKLFFNELYDILFNSLDIFIFNTLFIFNKIINNFIINFSVLIIFILLTYKYITIIKKFDALFSSNKIYENKINLLINDNISNNKFKDYTFERLIELYDIIIEIRNFNKENNDYLLNQIDELNIKINSNEEQNILFQKDYDNIVNDKINKNNITYQLKYNELESLNKEALENIKKYNNIIKKLDIFFKKTNENIQKINVLNAKNNIIVEKLVNLLNVKDIK
jgi:hypothetical protein